MGSPDDLKHLINELHKAKSGALMGRLGLILASYSQIVSSPKCAQESLRGGDRCGDGLRSGALLQRRLPLVQKRDPFLGISPFCRFFGFRAPEVAGSFGDFDGTPTYEYEVRFLWAGPFSDEPCLRMRSGRIRAKENKGLSANIGSERF